MGKRKTEEVSEAGLKKPSGLLVDPQKPWFLVKIKDEWEVTGPRPGAAAELAEVTRRATGVYARQVELYEKQRDMSKSDRDWLKTVMSSGTTSDKCSTFQVQITEAPLYCAQYFEKLLEMARSTGRHEATQALAALEKVFGTVLPPAGARKLYYLKQRKWADAAAISEKGLLVAYFEDAVKRAFFEFLKLVEIMAQDQIAHSRELAMRTLCQIATGKDEQLSNMVALIANKLGDPERKLASRAMYYLQEIINGQPASTEIVIGHVEQLVQRPGVSEKAQYYGLTFLSQIMLSHALPAITERLVKLYLAVLKLTIIPSIVKEAERAKAAKKAAGKRKGRKVRKAEQSVETELAPATNRMAKVVITGLNRALPFYKGPVSLLAELSAPIQRLIAGHSFATSLQALSLYFQLAAVDKQAGLSEAFVAAVEGVLGKGEAVIEASCHPQLLTLTYKILVHEGLNAQLTERLLRSLFALTIKVPSTAFSLASLLLLADLFQHKPATRAILTIPSDSSSKDQTGGCLWSLHVMAQHYDERVSALASGILAGNPDTGLLGGKSPFDLCTPSAILQTL